MQAQLSQIANELQKLLTLLTACTVACHAVGAGACLLQQHAAQLQPVSQHACSHLTCMREMLLLMADDTAVPANVAVSLSQLHGTSLDLKAGPAKEVQHACNLVQHACNLVHHALSEEAPAVGFVADQLRLSLEEQACEVRNLEAELEKALEEGRDSTLSDPTTELVRDVLRSVRCFNTSSHTVFFSS